ncbi:serine/threonine protein kinase [Sorangium cellulosum]|uniref:serine/threonine protein kinase n=1 Tax=Sorangium TaxID=39643 RepID=UPI0009D6A8EA|nr:serine/threonine-protein kinase [Sorangium cellulosum]
MIPQPELLPGKELGHYELLLPIAQGGMATVWAARRKGLRGFQKTVAIKTMLPSLSDDPQFETMFLEEARLASGIHHPNVAEILDLGEQNDVLYIVMEWVDGEALSVIARAANKSGVAIPLRVALRILSRACLGLHAAHELRDPQNDDLLLGLVHRDVSPQNILVTYDGHVKLVDFGVAKATNRAHNDTTAGQIKGKVPYMSPEQARGERVDRRTDIFAMGIVLYKLTTGEHPFAAENDLLTLKQIISRPALAPRLKNPDFPAELEHVLMTCLQKDPDHRYQTMLELETALESVLAKEPPVTDHDVGAFVRGLLGERNQRRRAALRDTVRALDERASRPPELMLLRDSISEFFFTQPPPGHPNADAPTLRASAPSLGRHMLPSLPQSSPGQETPLGPIEVPASRRRSGTLVAAVSLALVAAVGAGMMWIWRPSPQDVSSEQITLLAGSAGAVAAAATTGAPAISAGAASAMASSVAEGAAPAPETSDVAVAEEPGTSAPRRAAGRAPTASSAAAPGATAAGSSAAGARRTAPRKPPSTKWVPTVTNPGF